MSDTLEHQKDDSGLVFTSHTDRSAAKTEEPTQLMKADAWFNRHAEPRVPLVAMNDDAYRMPGQNWVCYSVIRPNDYGSVKGPDGQPYKSTLLKFRGAFGTLTEADVHIKEMMKIDGHHDVKLVPAHKWTLLDDDGDIENTEYHCDTVSAIMKAHFTRQRRQVAAMGARMAGADTQEKLEEIKASGTDLADSLVVKDVLDERDRIDAAMGDSAREWAALE
jgi:hypothetical protein